MSTNVVWPPIGGSTYAIPASGEVDWPALSSFLIAIGQGAQPQTYQKVAIRTATATPVTVVSATDCIVVTNLSVAGAVAVTLPAGVAGQWYAIIDGKGDAASNNITITPNGAETINGAATFVIKENRGGIIIAFASSNWTVISEYTAEVNQGSTGTGLIVRQTSPTINTPTIGTSATVPLVIGGTGTGSTLTFQTTSGNGSTDQMLFKTGNNGAVTAASISTSGLIDVGTSNTSLKGTHFQVVDPNTSTPSSAHLMIISCERNSSTASSGLLIRANAGTGASTNGLLDIMNQTTTLIFQVNNSGITQIGASGTTPTHKLNTNTATTVGAAGGASALPATPTGYVIININGTDRKIPYYAT